MRKITFSHDTCLLYGVFFARIFTATNVYFLKYAQTQEAEPFRFSLKNNSLNQFISKSNSKSTAHSVSPSFENRRKSAVAIISISSVPILGKRRLNPPEYPVPKSEDRIPEKKFFDGAFSHPSAFAEQGDVSQRGSFSSS